MMYNGTGELSSIVTTPTDLFVAAKVAVHNPLRIGRSEERGFYADRPKQPEPRENGPNRPPRRSYN